MAPTLIHANNGELIGVACDPGGVTITGGWPEDPLPLLTFDSPAKVRVLAAALIDASIERFGPSPLPRP